jgi:hypothetical protein
VIRKPLSDGSCYYANLAMPRKNSAGRVLAHNRVRHTLDMPNGRNGFRCWTWPQGQVPATTNPANADGRACHTIGCASSRRAKTRKVMSASRSPN